MSLDVKEGVEDDGGDPSSYGSKWDYKIVASYDELVWRLDSSIGGVSTELFMDGSLTLNANNDPGAGTLTFTITGGPWIVEDWASGEGGGIADINMQHVIYDPGSSNPSYEVTITTMDIVSTEFDGKVSVTTTTPLEGNSDAPPTSGVLVITGGGESLEIDAAAPGCPRPADQYEVINRTYASGGTDCYDW